MNLKNLSMEELQALRKDLGKKISSLNNFQMARKIQLNSLFGALG
jgi:hypothetical protein